MAISPFGKYADIPGLFANLLNMGGSEDLSEYEEDEFPMAEEEDYDTLLRKITYQLKVSESQGIPPGDILMTPDGPGVPQDVIDTFLKANPGARYLSQDEDGDVSGQFANAEMVSGKISEDVDKVRNLVSREAEDTGNIGSEQSVWDAIIDQVGLGVEGILGLTATPAYAAGTGDVGGDIETEEDDAFYSKGFGTRLVRATKGILGEVASLLSESKMKTARREAEGYQALGSAVEPVVSGAVDLAGEALTKLLEDEGKRAVSEGERQLEFAPEVAQKAITIGTYPLEGEYTLPSGEYNLDLDTLISENDLETWEIIDDLKKNNISREDIYHWIRNSPYWTEENRDIQEQIRGSFLEGPETPLGEPETPLTRDPFAPTEMPEDMEDTSRADFFRGVPRDETGTIDFDKMFGGPPQQPPLVPVSGATSQETPLSPIAKAFDEAAGVIDPNMKRYDVDEVPKGKDELNIASAREKAAGELGTQKGEKGYDENLRAIFYNIIYARPGAGRSDVNPYLGSVYNQTITLFFLHNGLEAWGLVRAMQGEGTVALSKEEATRRLETNYRNFLVGGQTATGQQVPGFLDDPSQYRTGRAFKERLQTVTRILGRIENDNLRISEESDPDFSDRVWVESLFGGTNTESKRNREDLIKIHVTGGGMGYYSQQIHSSIGKLMQYYRNIGKTPGQIFSAMLGLRGESVETQPPMSDLELAEGPDPLGRETGLDYKPDYFPKVARGETGMIDFGEMFGGSGAEPPTIAPAAFNIDEEFLTGLDPNWYNAEVPLYRS